MKHLITGLMAMTLLGGCASGTNFLPMSANTYTINRDEITVRAIMTAQDNAWNRGDIDGFMQGYWRDEALRFASGGTVTRGWRATLDRYHQRYTDRDAMGTLTTSDLEIVQVSGDAMIVHGAWARARKADDLSGLFTLVFRKIDGEWMIISDTTTSAN
jgi:ketosteroid isomerase-like protein